MNKRILIALDGSENAMRAVNYVGRMVSSLPDLEVTLLHIAPYQFFPRFPFRELDKIRGRWEQEMAKEMDNVFRLAKEDLTDAGIDPNRIHVKLIPQERDVALDIISEAKEANCSIIVVGRKAHSMVAKVFLGSVSNKIVHHAHDCTMWVVE